MEIDPFAILKEIHSAIDTELKTVRRYGATSRITLLSGIKSTKEFSRANLYRFEMLIQRNFPDGSQGKLVYKGKISDARVVMTEGQCIWLDISEGFGERIPHAFFDVDLSFLLEDLKGKYSALMAGQISMSLPGTHLILANISDSSSYPSHLTVSFDYLSEEQFSTVEKMISMEIGAIHGPPGTGKTRTLAGMLVECFASEERILVCGYTNRSVDEALGAFKKAARKCIPDQFEVAFKTGRILRKGINVFPEDEPIVRNSDEVIFDVKKGLQDELDSVLKTIRDTESTLNNMKQVKRFLDIRNRFIADISVEEEKYKSNDNKISESAKKIKVAKEEIQNIMASGFLTRVFKRGRLHSLESEIRYLEAQNTSTSSEQARILNRIGSLKLKVKQVERDLSKFDSEIRNLNAFDLKAKIDFYTNELESLKRKVSDLERAIEDAPQTVLTNARIIFATLSRSHIDNDINKANFDRVFIDESSMVPLPQMFFVGFRAVKSICIFGDPKQLAPICISNKEEVRKWFSKDIYKYAGLDDSSKNSVAELLTQRRMPEELGKLVSSLFYRNKLKHEWIGETNPTLPWMGDRKIALLNTADQGAFCNRHEIGQGYSRINVVHAVISLSILKEAQGLGIDTTKMAYITPYRAQAEFFGSLVLKNREVLKTNFLEGLRWGTVHRFQGGEAELVVYDTCESPRELPTRLTGGSDKLDTEDIEIDDASRLHCVALSRAKLQLIILANLRWLRETLPESSKLSEIVNKISKLGSVIPIPEEHSALRIFSKEMPKGLFSINLEDAHYVLCDESNFYNLFENDIEICKEKVIIVSPYLGETRISLLETCFRQLNSKNIGTIVWTKDPSDLATRSERHKELAEQLNELGAEVLFRSGTHEKAVIIDETISYYGSLNPLSSINTKETMLRVKDKAFAKALIDHLKIGEEKSEPQGGFRGTRQFHAESVLERLGLKTLEGKIDPEKARKSFKKLRWIIAEDKGLPVQATLWGRTIEWLIEFRPKDLTQLYSCEEFRRNKTNIAGYEEVVLQIVDLIHR